jgi:hypothetical protein
VRVAVEAAPNLTDPLKNFELFRRAEQTEWFMRELARDSLALGDLDRDVEFVKLSNVTSASLFLEHKFYEQVGVASASVLCKRIHT